MIDPATERVLHSLQVGDIDGDGDPDVVTAEMHQGDDPDEVRVYENAGQGLSWTQARHRHQWLAQPPDRRRGRRRRHRPVRHQLGRRRLDGQPGGPMAQRPEAEQLPCRIDINADGRVDVADLLMLAQGFGSRGGDLRYAATRDLNKDVQIDVSDVLVLAGNWLRLIGDINADGRVDVADLLILAQNFGLRTLAVLSAATGDVNGDSLVDVSDC